MFLTPFGGLIHVAADFNPSIHEGDERSIATVDRLRSIATDLNPWLQEQSLPP